MSDIYISKIHGAKLKDEELTQKVSEGLVEHENKLDLLSNSIPYEWQYPDGRSKLLHYDWDIGCFGTMLEFPVDQEKVYVNFYLDTDGYGVYHLDATPYKYEDIDGGRCWYFKIHLDDSVVDGYYVFILEAGSESVKATGYNAVLYQDFWEDKEQGAAALVKITSCGLNKGMTRRGYQDTFYTYTPEGSSYSVKLATAPDIYTFTSMEDAFNFRFTVYRANGKQYKNGLETVSEVIAALKELGVTEYTQTVTYDELSFYLDISADNPLILERPARVVYGDFQGSGEAMDCDFVPYAETGVQKICRRYGQQPK